MWRVIIKTDDLKIIKYINVKERKYNEKESLKL